jgi:hypothetical protein
MELDQNGAFQWVVVMTDEVLPHNLTTIVLVHPVSTNGLLMDHPFMTE